MATEEPHVVTVEASGGADAPRNTTRRSFGFVVEADGFILTTYHNLLDSDSQSLLPTLRVRVEGDDALHLARLIGVEPTLDLAVLRLESGTPLRASEIHSDQSLEIGQEVYAITHLDDDDGTRTLGRLTELNSKECYQESLTSTMYRAEMTLPASAVGTPLYSKDGTVVAIHTGHQPLDTDVHQDDADVIHVLPIFLASNIYNSIKQKESLLSPWTGFSVRKLSAEEASIFPTTRGHRGGIAIDYVWKDGPAARMGIREGDILVQLSHNPITSVADFQKWLYMYGVDHSVKLVLIREGESYLASDYVIEERPVWAKPR